VVAATTVAALGGLAGCGSDGKKDDATATTTTTTAVTTTLPVKPSVDHNPTLPDDPCTVTQAALATLRWTVEDAVSSAGVGSVTCTFSGTNGSGTPDNGYVIFMDADTASYVPHTDRQIEGVGVPAYEIDPAAEQILVMGPTALQVLVASGESEKVAVARAVVAGL
jgi:hypothetical protein